MTTDTQRKLRQLLRFNANEPRIDRIAHRRSSAALADNADRLKRLSGNEYARTVRTVTLNPAPDPKAAWLIRHHIREARRNLNDFTRTITAPMKGPDAVLAGPAHHRIKLVNRIPGLLRNRLDPIFAKGDLWDSEGEYRQRFDEWERDLLTNLPPGKTPGKLWWPFHREVFLDRLTVIENWLAEVLALFGEEDERKAVNVFT